MKTIISLLLDRSGSMAGMEKDVVGGVNKFIADQQKDAGEDTITLARFDSAGLEVFRPRGKVAEAHPIEAHDFVPRGGTPLLDCLGKLIAQMDEDWKAEKPDRAICVVFTDGHENESKEFTKDKIKALIEAREKSGLWAFIYMGAHADAFDEAVKYGFATHHTTSYGNTPLGTRAAYAAVSSTVSTMKSSGHMAATNLGGKIEDDGSIQKAAGQPQSPPPAWVPPPPVVKASTPSTTPAWTPPS